MFVLCLFSGFYIKQQRLYSGEIKQKIVDFAQTILWIGENGIIRQAEFVSSCSLQDMR